MAHKHDDHDHEQLDEHGHDHSGHDHHGHEHGPEPLDIPGVNRPAEDTANKSLSDALHMSFRLLSVIMVFVLAALVLTGISQVQPTERGVRLLFGAIQGEGRSRVLPEGLNWSWPEPIGKVEKIPVDQRKLEIKDFWFRVQGNMDIRKLSEIQTSGEGLKPGYDGALLTADRSLVHVLLTCQYRIATGESGTDSIEIVDYLTNVAEPEELVRSVVCAAANHAAAIRTADVILNNKDEFCSAIRQEAQKQLSRPDSPSGIQIQQIQMEAATVPLAVIPSQNAVTSSQQEASTEVSKAKSDAVSWLNQTSGQNWKKLVGDPDSSADLGLLQQYAMLREKGDSAGAEALIGQIDTVLLDSGGQVAQILNEAKASNETLRQRVAGKVKEFQGLAENYEKTPQLMLQRLWTEAKQQILTSKLIEKFYVTPGAQKTVIMINEDPEVLKAMAKEKLTNPTGKPQ